MAVSHAATKRDVWLRTRRPRCGGWVAAALVQQSSFKVAAVAAAARKHGLSGKPIHCAMLGQRDCMHVNKRIPQTPMVTELAKRSG